jgi:hypothetical protein
MAERPPPILGLGDGQGAALESVVVSLVGVGRIAGGVVGEEGIIGEGRLGVFGPFGVVGQARLQVMARKQG